MGKLNGKTAIVTGASRGIGAEIAKYLAKEGARVVVNYSGSQSKAEEVVKEIEALGGKAFAVQASVSDADSVSALISATLKHFGSIDILVNNAGITRDNLIMRMKENEWVVTKNVTSVDYGLLVSTRQHV